MLRTDIDKSVSII